MKALVPSTLLVLACGACREASPEELLVAAASSLRELAETSRADFERDHPGTRLRFSFAASSTLARQLDAGVPYDVFLSADEESASRVGSILEPPREFLSNRLALVAAPGSESGVRAPADLASAQPRAQGWIAIAAASVPAGRYARELLRSEGLLELLEPRFVLGDNVRKTLSLVESGAAAFGFVYLSDHAISAATELLWSSPPGSTPRIRYVAAARRGADPRASDYVSWLRGEAFQGAVEERGFLRSGP